MVLLGVLLMVATLWVGTALFLAMRVGGAFAAGWQEPEYVPPAVRTTWSSV